ncbi:hypothetical protein ACPTK3_30960, partial [Pseudomonas aeruginosa]
TGFNRARRPSRIAGVAVYVRPGLKQTTRPRIPRRGLARRFAAGLQAAALGLGGRHAQAATTLNLCYNGGADCQ